MKTILALFTFVISTHVYASSCGGLFNPVLGLSERIMAKATHIQIDHERIRAVAYELALAKYPLALADWNFPPYVMNAPIEEMLPFFLALDSINYMYWNPDKPQETYQTRNADGSIATGASLVAQRLGEHLEDWLLNPEKLSRITKKQVTRELLVADVEIPAATDRARHLREVGQFLKTLEGENWNTFLSQFSGPVALAEWIAQEIPGFRDPFLKRAQLFAGMLSGRFQNDPNFPAQLKDTRAMTAYADYLLPVVGARLGILAFSSELRSKIENGDLIERGSPYENELRASTVLFVRALREELNQLPGYAHVTDPMVDAMAWLNGALLTGEVTFLPDFLKIPGHLIVEQLKQHPRIITTDY